MWWKRVKAILKKLWLHIFWKDMKDNKEVAAIGTLVLVKNAVDNNDFRLGIVVDRGHETVSIKTRYKGELITLYTIRPHEYRIVYRNFLDVNVI